MRRLRIGRPSPSLVIAIIALFVAVGGVAGALPGRNSVDSGDIRNNQVKGVDVVEATLGKVRKSGRADTATFATRANSATSAFSADRATSADTAGTAGDASKLGGLPADAYQESADLLFATIEPASPAMVIKKSRGVNGLARVTAGHYEVKFVRSVDGCTWGATYGDTQNDSSDAKFATVRGTSDPTRIGVVIRDAAGGQVDGEGFTVQAFCP